MRPVASRATEAGTPIQTLTFLFTDIEGSTALWERDPDAMRASLARHDSILREAIEGAGGQLVKSTGDGIMAAFSSSIEGLTASATALLALQREAWIGMGPLRVRVGLHTGEVPATGDDYHGPAVNRAARIMGAASGGQILLSRSTAMLVMDELPEEWSLLDLGEHTLKGLTRPERIFQLAHPDLERDFPSLASAVDQAAGLPSEPSAFIGRGAELRRLVERLWGEVRLVTLLGPGGIGKTRLALRAAGDLQPRFADGATFVDLSAATDTGSVVLALARAFGIADRSEDEQLDVLAERLREQERLLLLDNFEQATAAAPAIVSLLDRCPRLKVLVTSREALNVRGEQVWPLPPLAVPDETRSSMSVTLASGFESVQLFVERAQAVRPDFELTEDNAATIVEICRRLDGLPLAIELATARIGIFSPTELLRRLGRSLDVLKGGPRDLPERQRTLRGTIEWSHDLLDEDEQSLFALLAAFAGADLEAAEAVAGRLDGRMASLDLIGGLAALTSRSLLRQQESDRGSRFSMLQTIREYAVDQLEADPDLATAVREAHAQYFLELAQRQAERLAGREREDALAVVTDDRENLDLCWRYWLERRDQECLDSLMDALWALYDATGWYRAMIGIAQEMLEVLATNAPSTERDMSELSLRMSMARAIMAMEGFTPEVEASYTRAMELFAEGEDDPRLYPVLRAMSHYHVYRAEFEKSTAMGRRIMAMADREGDHSMRTEGLLITGVSVAMYEHLGDGLEMIEQALTGFAAQPFRGGRYRAGNDPRVVARTTSAIVLWLLGRIDESQRRADAALGIADELFHPPSRCYAKFHAGFVYFLRGEHEVQRDLARGVLEVAESYELDLWRAVGACLLGTASAGLGRAEEGLVQIEEGIALYHGIKSSPPVFWPMLVYMRAWACHKAGSSPDGLAHVDAAIAQGGNAGPFIGELLVLRGDLLDEAAGAERAAAYAQALEASVARGTLTPQLRAATRRVQFPVAGDDEAALLGTLAEVYGRFSEGFGTAALVEARAVLDERGALPAGPTSSR